MPWKVYKESGRYCLYKKNADGSKGDKVPGGCHETADEARKHQAALYDNVEEALLEADTEIVEAETGMDDDECPEGEDCMEVTPEQAMIFASLPDMEFEVEYEDGDTEPFQLHGLQAALAKPRRYVRRILFKNWAVAKQERNHNGDYISEDNIDEFVASASQFPITDTHVGRGKRATIFGTMTAGRAALVQGEKGSVDRFAMVDGYFWAGRYPKLVRDTITGLRLPSIEAMAMEEECSLCGQRFGPDDPRCDHLQPLFAGNKLPDNVSRRHYGLRAMGVAAVPNPAGSDVGFYAPRFFLSASELEENDMTEQTIDTSALDKQIADLTQANGVLLTERDGLKTSLEASEKATSTLRSRVIALLDANVDGEKIKHLVVADDFVAMPDSAFNLVCESLKPVTKLEPVPAQPTVVADEQTGPGLSWATIYGG